MSNSLLNEPKTEKQFGLTDFFDIELLQKIQDSYFKITNLAMGFSDINGDAVTKHCSRHEYCTKFTKQSALGASRCKKCDEYNAKMAAKTKDLYVSICHNGLVDFVAPICANGQMIGTFHGGQVTSKRESDDVIRQKAVEFGLDPEDYLEAYKKVPVLTEDDIKNQAEFIHQIANMMSNMAYSKYIIKQASREFEHEAHMKSDFLANMSHEIRTPMNAVIGMAEMALREDLSAEARDYILQIRTASNSLLTIINDILDYSKMESGKMDIHMVEYQTVEQVKDIGNIIQTRIGEKKLEFLVDYDPDIPEYLMGDNIRIKQIIMNLANNAVKFTKEGFVLLKIGFTKSNEKEIVLQVSVEDSGIGIKEENMSKLFQSFTQLDSKRNRNIEGTGLGLAISKQLVELMHGSISVKSEYEKGSIFSFELPQIVLEDKPSVSFEHCAGIKAAVLTDNDYLAKSMENNITRLGAGFYRMETEAKIRKAGENGVSFVFVDETLYSESLRVYARLHPEITYIVMTGFKTELESKIDNLLIVKKPLYSFNLAKIFKKEVILIEKDKDQTVEFDFTAPEAEILIVDDNELNLTVACGLIKPLKMKVETALSGKEAIEKISVKHYDLIFMDHMMPELDGVETTHIIRRFHEEYNSVPIIALTANAMEETRSMFLVEGMNDIVLKPIEIRIMAEKIKRWLPAEKIVPLTEEEMSEAMKKKEKQIEESDKLKKLRETDKLDVSSAMVLLGDEGLFWETLKDYYMEIDNKTEALKKHMGTGDFKNYKIIVHALKSASRQIGAQELADLAAGMEHAVGANNMEFLHAHHPDLLTMYAEYKTLLTPFMEPENTVLEEEKEPINDEVLKNCFAKLREAAEELDLDGMDGTMEELEQYRFPEEQQSNYKDLVEAARCMDVDACMEIMERFGV